VFRRYGYMYAMSPVLWAQLARPRGRNFLDKKARFVIDTIGGAVMLSYVELV